MLLWFQTNLVVCWGIAKLYLVIKLLKYFVLLEVVALGLVTLLYSPATQAHFLLQDTDTGIKVVFHSAPDDDPIAGQNSVLSFDFSKNEKGIQNNTYSFTLSIKDESGKVQDIPYEITANDIIAQYTFPQQGLYSITLYITPKDGSGKSSTLEYTQRISRGVVSSTYPSKSLQSQITVFALIFLLVVGTIVLVIREFRKG